MPLKTFYNLSIEKQDKIINAAFEEFSKNSLENSTISNILSSLSMPRGTFYRYFKDIEDLYFYILSLKQVNLMEIMGNSISPEDNDFSAVYNKYILKVADSIYNIKNRKFYKVFFLSWNMDMQSKIKNNMKNTHFDFKIFETLFSKYNLNKEELQDLHLLIKNISHYLINRSFMEDWNKDRFIKKFVYHMKIIEKGIK